MRDAAPGSSITVMIVEDENIVALDMRCRLEALGYRVCAVVATGAAAISEASAQRPDLVLMDIQLKGAMDGVEAARRLRLESGIPIVFVTAFTDDATLERVKVAGAYGYIVKPYHERELRISIELALSKYNYELKLRDAKELAEASDKAKTRFLANISHELKTPLNSIVGFLDLAGSVATGDELCDDLSMAARSARKLETVIDSILYYTKLELGALAPVPDDFDLDQFLLSCWEPFAFEAHAKGLAARLGIDPDLPGTVRGDAGKLCTLVRNLLENAVKFTDTGYVVLSAELESTSGGAGEMVLRVTDTGRGIPEDQRQAMYRPFTQGDDSPTRASGGMGLGLTLAKALSDLLHTRLSFNPLAGGGSEFLLRVELPEDFVPAFPAIDCVTKPVGLLGRVQAREELERWAPRLGVHFVDLPGGEALDSRGSLLYPAVVADEEAWSKTDETQRAALLGGDYRRLVLVGKPCSREYIAGRLGPGRLQYPPSLATFAQAVRRALDPDREHDGRMNTAAPVVHARSPAVLTASDKSATSMKRRFAKPRRMGCQQN
jgi:signal transduction histidine kinase